MKNLLALAALLSLSTSAQAALDCRFSDHGIDQMEGLSLSDKGTCFRSNGYSVGEYSLTITQENGQAAYLCTNLHQNSWYPVATKILIGNGKTTMLEFLGGEWKQARAEVTCK